MWDLIPIKMIPDVVTDVHKSLPVNISKMEKIVWMLRIIWEKDSWVLNIDVGNDN